MIDDTRAARLMELLDRRERGTLSLEQSKELESMLSPDLVGAADETLDDPMGDTLDRAVDHFDFARARRAMEGRLRADRTVVRLGATMISLIVLIAAALAWWRGDWGALIFTVAAQAMVPLVWMLLVARRRASAMEALAGRLPIETAFAQHRVASQRERVVMQAAVVVGSLGFALLTIEGALSGDRLRLLAGAIMLVAVLPFAWHRAFSQRGRQQRHAFVEGHSTASSWLRGVDERRA